MPDELDELGPVQSTDEAVVLGQYLIEASNMDPKAFTLTNRVKNTTD